MGKLNGKITLDKDYKAGEVVEAQFEYAEDDFQEKVKDRLRREAEKIADVTKEKDALQAQVEELKKAVDKDATPDEKTAQALAETQKQIEQLKGELAAKNHAERVAKAIQKSAKDLPDVFRKQIQVAQDASDEELAEAIKAQQEEYKGFLKSQGIDPEKKKDEEEPGYGGGGSGSAREVKPTAEQDKLLQRIKRIPSLASVISTATAEEAVKAAKAWEEDGTLAKAEAAAAA